MQQDHGPQGQSPDDGEAIQSQASYGLPGTGRDHGGDRSSPPVDVRYLSLGVGGDHSGDVAPPEAIFGLAGVGGDKTGDAPVRFEFGAAQDIVGGPPDQPDGAPGLGRDGSGD